MWKRAVFAGSVLLGAAAFGQNTPSARATYWQDDACAEVDLGAGAQLLWCVDSVVVAESGEMEVQVSWRGLNLAGRIIEKGSDTANNDMYLVDDLGNRYDHTATRGGADEGGRLDAARPLLRGAYLFPPPRRGAKSFTFHDSDQSIAIGGIVLSQKLRTDRATSARLLGRVMQAHDIRIAYGFRGLGGETMEEYLLSPSESGYRAEGVRDGVNPIKLSEPVIPASVIESFLLELTEAPLLEKEYVPTITRTDDYPSISVELDTGSDKVVLFSRSQGRGHVPWAAEVKEKTYVIPDDTPARALLRLDPYFGRDPGSRAVRFLEPHLGEEEARKLWARLDDILDTEEAYKVAFRLKDLLGRGGDDDQVWKALEDYLRSKTAPVASARLPNGDTELVDAARRGDIVKLRSMLDRGIDLNEKSPLDGSTALIAAASNNHTEAVRLLLSAGADVDARSTGGETALTRAASANHAETLEALLEAGASADVKGRDRKTPLMQAAENGYAETVATLLRAGADPNEVSLHGETALSLAAQSHHLPVVRLLLGSDADPNIRDRDGQTALMKTADPRIARALLRAGADVNAVDTRGLTPAMSLVEAAEWRRFSQTRPGSPPDRAGTLRMLLAHGADVRVRDREGKTALIWATGGSRGSTSHPELLPLLIEAGADIDARDRQGRTALHHAVLHGHAESVGILIEGGADVNAKMGDSTALSLALKQGHTDVVKLLLRAGARR